MFLPAQICYNVGLKLEITLTAISESSLLTKPKVVIVYMAIH